MQLYHIFPIIRKIYVYIHESRLATALQFKPLISTGQIIHAPKSFLSYPINKYFSYISTKRCNQHPPLS